MIQIDRTPKCLKPFRSLGIDLAMEGSQARGTCPFCDTAKMYVNPEEGTWDCKACRRSGNLSPFGPSSILEQFWDHCQCPPEQAEHLAESRGIINPQTLERWGLVQSHLNGEWLAPGYDGKGNIAQLYRWVQGQVKMEFRALAGLEHGLHGVDLYEGSKSVVYLCEGIWDGMALWETLRSAARTDNGIKYTGNELVSLEQEANVLAVPGCGVFREEWCPYFTGKQVILLYDSDYPKKGQEPVGMAGMKRVTSILSRQREKPESIHWLAWGKEGYDPQRKDGFDIRDWLNS